jgi:peptide subunit release factor 1 (eRF1)
VFEFSRKANTPSSRMSQDVAEQNIQMWKVKKLIKSLDSARGSVTFLDERFTAQLTSIACSRAGTSMISLIIPPKVNSDFQIGHDLF